MGAISLHCALSLTPLFLGIRALSIEAAKELLAIKLETCEVEIGGSLAPTKQQQQHLCATTSLLFRVTPHFFYLCSSFTLRPRKHLNMSGAFNYPREEHHVVLNVDDSVVVDWWSTFADTLVIQCYERGDIEAGDEESEIHHSPSYRRSSANIESRLQHSN